MNISKSTIKGNEYWYCSDLIYINRGVTKKISRSLGRVDSTSKEGLERRKFDVQRSIAALEEKARTTYWTKKTKHRFFAQPIVARLESLRTTLYRAKHDLAPIADSALEMAFLVDFIYNSNRIEGSRIPRGEVQRIIESGKKKNNEVLNTSKAREFVDNDFRFTIQGILSLQKILLAHEPTKIGFRDIDEMIVGNEPILCKAKAIKPELKKLLDWYTKNRFILYPPELAFEFYRRFERIHPFLDGNGRTGRLLMNKILKEARYHPIIIWSKNNSAHKAAFKASTENPSKYMRFMVDQYRKTHEVYLKKIQPAIDFARQVDFFLSPSE